MKIIKPIDYCSHCLYPRIAVNLSVDDDGVCSACRTSENMENLEPNFWAERREDFKEVVEEIKSNNSSEYDCIIPVSGGKDSYYQTHIMVKEFGLKPLLVTYHGNNYLPEGDYNRDRMRHVFDCDHLVFGPSVDVLKKLNRLCFKKMGDMNWQNHCGIFTLPIQMAVKFKIPLMIWGEISWDISGMHDIDDLVEFSARVRHEHGLRGFEWNDLINDPVDTLIEKDMKWAKYPTDQDILDVGVRGLYIGNFFEWEPNNHTKKMIDLYGWKPAEKPFERTYRLMSNLDDRYENGIHDLMKFIKFGYGRATDHASKDIRSGHMTRSQGLDMVKKYDHIVSSDLYYWLDYVDMKEEEFWIIADSFRDPRVWWIKDDLWWKADPWGGCSQYGSVHMSKLEMEKYKCYE